MQRSLNLPLLCDLVDAGMIFLAALVIAAVAVNLQEF